MKSTFNQRFLTPIFVGLVLSAHAWASHQAPPHQPSPQELQKLGQSAEEKGLFDQARHFYEKACNPEAEWGNDNIWPFRDPSTLFSLGHLLRTGKGGPVDATRAARCFVLALGIGIDASSARAWIGIIEMYRNGEGVPKDQKFADHLLQEFRFRAGDTRHWSTEDNRLLASMWERGEILPKNLLAASDQHYRSGDKYAARRVLEQAANEGDPFAFERLAWSYQGQGWVVTESNPQKAEECLAKAKALRQKTTLNTSKNSPKGPKTALRAWRGSAGPPAEGNDESLGEEKHRELSQCSDPVRALYHLLWADYLSPKG